MSRPNPASLRLAPVAAAAAAPAAVNLGARATSARQHYVQCLTWAFTLLSSLRLLSNLPTIWAIGISGDSSQHSLWTWGIWLGSNLTMALWLHEQSGQQWTKAALVNVVNAAMCAATLTVILVFRF